MKAPICDICLRSSILCSACKGKLDSGEITESDVRTFRILFEASDKFRSLRDVAIKKVMETSENTIIITDKGDAAKIIGKGGLIVKELSKILGKNVRVVEETQDKREFLEKLVFPAKILGMNVLYEDGGEFLKIIINRRLPLPESGLREIVRQVFGQEIKVVNE